MPEIFISYSHDNTAFVKKLKAALEKNGYKPEDIWVDFEDIPSATKWEEVIGEGIRSSNAIVFVLSPEFAESKECAKELKAAISAHKRLFPIVHKNVDPKSISQDLSSLNWIFMRSNDDFTKGIQALQIAIRTDRPYANKHTSLLEDANKWEVNKKQVSYLLRGEQLASAVSWLDQAVDKNKQPRPTPLQKEFIAASRQDEAKRQQTAKIRAITAMIISIALAIGAVISGLTALRSKQIAMASQLAAQASNLVNTQPDLAMFLSLQSNVIGDQLRISEPAWLGSLVTSLNNTPKLETYLREHTQDVRAVAFSPDGHWLATAGGSSDKTIGEVILWDMSSNNGAQSYTLFKGDATTPRLRFMGVVFSPDGSQLFASGEYDNTSEKRSLFVWETAKCVDHAQPCSPSYQWDTGIDVRAMTLVKIDNKNYIATASKNKVDFWDVTNGQRNDSLSLEANAQILSLAASPRNQLAAGDRDGFITVWDLRSKDVVFHECNFGDPPKGAAECGIPEENRDVRGLAFNPTGSLLIAGSADHRAWLWDSKTGNLLAKTAESNASGHINTVSGVAFNPKKDQVATVSWDNTVRLWDFENNNGVWSFVRTDTLAGHANSLWAVAYNPDGTQIASGSSDQTVILWDVDQLNQIGKEFATMQGETWALAMSPNKKQFAAGDDAGNIRIWKYDEANTHNPLQLVHEIHNPNESIYTLTYNHNGTWLASAGCDVWDGNTCKTGSIRVWDSQSGLELWNIPNAHTDQIWQVMFSPNDKILASISYDTTMKLWDTTTKQQIGKDIQHNEKMFALTFNENGTRLLSAGYENDIFRWNVDNPASPLSLPPLIGHTATVNLLAYNWKYPPLLASTSDDKSLLIWNINETNPELQHTPKVEGLNESMEAVTFNPSGNWLASATNNKTVLLWQLDSERCSLNWEPATCKPRRIGAPLVGHAKPVQNVIFLSDHALVSSGEDGQLILWDLDKQHWYEKACKVANRKLADSSDALQYMTEINTNLLAVVDWLQSKFTSQQVTPPPSCLQ